MNISLQNDTPCCAAVHTCLRVTSIWRICKYLTNWSVEWWSFLHMWRLQGLGRVELLWTDGWVICFLAYWCWYPVMFALAEFCRALPLKLACSFPPLHSHALMRALAFTLHHSPPLSPTRMVSSCAVSAVHVPRHSPTLYSSFLSLLSFYHPPSLALFHLTSLLPPLLLHPSGLPASPFFWLLHLPPFSHVLLFKPAFSLCIPPTPLPPPPPPPTTCLCSTPVSRQLCWTLCEISVGSCYRGTEWMMMVLLVLQGCCVLWPGKARMPFFVQSAQTAECVGCLVCTCLCACACVWCTDPRQVERQQVLAAVPKLSFWNLDEDSWV